MKPVSEEIEELRAMDVPALVTRYVAVFGKPPRVKHRDWLWRRIAWKIQEQRFGGLSEVARRRLDELIAEIDLPLGGRTVRGQVQTTPKRRGPVLGTVVTRLYHGQEVRAKAVEGGWEHDGVVYRSLSAIANRVTGGHWNGAAFFGLPSPRSKQ